MTKSKKSRKWGKAEEPLIETWSNVRGGWAYSNNHDHYVDKSSSVTVAATPETSALEVNIDVIYAFCVSSSEVLYVTPSNYGVQMHSGSAQSFIQSFSDKIITWLDPWTAVMWHWVSAEELIDKNPDIFTPQIKAFLIMTKGLKDEV